MWRRGDRTVLLAGLKSTQGALLLKREGTVEKCTLPFLTMEKNTCSIVEGTGSLNLSGTPNSVLFCLYAGFMQTFCESQPHLEWKNDKMPKKMILTSEQHAKHPFAGRNTHPLRGFVCMSGFHTYVFLFFLFLKFIIKYLIERVEVLKYTATLSYFSKVCYPKERGHIKMFQLLNLCTSQSKPD